MLIPAIVYKNQITAEMQKLYYTDDMMYLTGGMNNWNPDIADVPDEKTYQFAIVDNDNIVGFLEYHIDWYKSCADRFGLVSFDRGNPIIGVDVYKMIHRLIYGYKLHRIEFRMVGGNPVEKHYDRICNHFLELREKPEILEYISDSTLSKLLSLHYINGFDWEQTADLMFYSIRDIDRKEDV